MSKIKKHNDARDPSPIKKQAPATPLLTQASAAAQISAPTPSHSSTAVVAKGGARGSDSIRTARAVSVGTPVGGSQSRGASGSSESQSSESSNSQRETRAARESRALRDSDARSSPPGNIYSALPHDDDSVSSASSVDSPGPVFSVGSCIFPAESIYYNAVFQRRLHEIGPLRVSVQSDAFADFIPSVGHNLLPEAAGLQHYLSPPVPLTDFSLSAVQEATLTPLRTCHKFDQTVFDSIELPEAGLKASTVVQIGKVFNDHIQKLSPSCPQNMSTVVNSSPDAIIRLAHGGTTTIGVGNIFKDPAFKKSDDPLEALRFHSSRVLNASKTKKISSYGPWLRRVSLFDRARWEQVFSFNDTQFDSTVPYFGRDILFQFEVFHELHRLLFQFFLQLSVSAVQRGLPWATSFATKLEEHQKLAEEHSYFDYGVLPTFAVLHLLNDQKNFYSGAVAFQLFLDNFSLTPLACRHSDIATVYSFSFTGTKPILEELTAFENAYWLIRESSVDPASPCLTHPALAENLVVSVVYAACVDLEKRASSASVTHKAADLVNFRVFLDQAKSSTSFTALRKLLTAITPAIGPLLSSSQVAFLAAPTMTKPGKKTSATAASAAVATDSTLAQSVAQSGRGRSNERTRDASVDRARSSSASKHLMDKEKRAKERRALARLLDPVKAYTLIHEGVSYALADSSGKRVKLPFDLYKELSSETKQAFLDLKVFKLSPPPEKKEKSPKQKAEPKGTHQAQVLLASQVPQSQPNAGHLFPDSQQFAYAQGYGQQGFTAPYGPPLPPHAYGSPPAQVFGTVVGSSPPIASGWSHGFPPAYGSPSTFFGGQMQHQFGPPYAGGHQAGASGSYQAGASGGPQVGAGASGGYQTSAGGGSQVGAGGGFLNSGRSSVTSYQGAQQQQPQNRLLLTEGSDPGAFYRS